MPSSSVESEVGASRWVRVLLIKVVKIEFEDRGNACDDMDEVSRSAAFVVLPEINVFWFEIEVIDRVAPETATIETELDKTLACVSLEDGNDEARRGREVLTVASVNTGSAPPKFPVVVETEGTPVTLVFVNGGALVDEGVDKSPPCVALSRPVIF